MSHPICKTLLRYIAACAAAYSADRSLDDLESSAAGLEKTVGGRQTSSRKSNC